MGSPSNKLEQWIIQTVVGIQAGEKTYDTIHVNELERNYSPKHAIEVGHAALAKIINHLGERGLGHGLAARLVFEMEPTESLCLDYPDLNSWSAEDLDAFTPPSLYILRADESMYEPYLEQFRRPLMQNTHEPEQGRVIAWYSSQRSLRYVDIFPEFARRVCFDYLPNQAPTK